MLSEIVLLTMAEWSSLDVFIDFLKVGLGASDQELAEGCASWSPILRLAIADQAAACARWNHSSKPMRPRRASPTGTSECSSTRPPQYRASGSLTTSRGSPTARR